MAQEALAVQTQPPAFEGPVVGIGASAGGLDALERLFSRLGVGNSAAFVVIQHLSPDHKSMMDNLIARYTAMRVVVAEEGMALAPNVVFLIPPGKEMRLEHGRLHLSPKPEHGLSLPIDIFFRSLAEQCADRAIAVVLSGTGSDGSRGLVAVNAAGGFVFVQEPASARFDGMPRSAIATGLVDRVAPVEALADNILARLRAPPAPLLRPVAAEDAEGGGSAEAELPATAPLEGIFSLLEAGSGIDFRDYKPSTVGRRIERRMLLLGAPTLAEYFTRLRDDAAELALLRRELLIPVTRFFRDTEAFEQLATDIISPLLLPPPETPRERRRVGDNRQPVRIWVACCATGEEAYTMAMLFAEAATALGSTRPVKIFATDVEQAYLDQAGQGHYPETIAAEVSPERLERFFVAGPRGGFAVRPEIRQMVIFARHNLLADPPFTRMDLVSCRNALIYMQPGAQERALRRLQYALNNGGTLMLGSSESLGALHRDFAALPGRGRLHRLLRRDTGVLALEGGTRHLLASRGSGSRRPALAARGAEGVGVVAAGQRELMQRYAPPTLLVGPARELVHVYGAARDWLQLPEGEATLDVLRLLPRELAAAASLLLQAAQSQRRPQQSAPLRLPAAGSGDDGDTQAEAAPRAMRRVRLVARPLELDEARRAVPGANSGVNGGVNIGPNVSPNIGPNSAMTSAAPAVLLSIEDLGAEGGAGPARGMLGAEEEMAVVTAFDAAQQQRIELLESELALTHDTLQATIEELETANEELQATNEELMASNEELQSTNEELQSVNEELYTVNSEYQEKVEVLNSVNADLENVVKAAGIPTLFVDEGLHLTRFTPELAQLFKVREVDIGRSIEDFANLLDYPELFADLRRTLAERRATEREVKSKSGEWWLSRIQPYAGMRTDGARAVMTFFNVSSLKDARRLQAVLDSLAEHVAVLDAQGTITLVNTSWRRFAAANGDADLASCGPGVNYLAVCARAAQADDADGQRAFQGLNEVLAGQRQVFTLQYPCDTPTRRLWFMMHVAPVAQAGGGAVVSHIDITSWAAPQAEEAAQ